jgi:signal transduction histidine kinase
MESLSNQQSDQMIRVVLVEDNPGDANLIKEYLTHDTRARFEIQIMTRLDDALEKISKDHVDIVLVDLGLPDSQGIATFEKMQERFPSIPIVVMSGLSDEAVAMEAMRKGAQDYLMKGEVDRKILLRVLQYAIERKKIDRLKDEFVSSVSHEIRTPIAIVKEGVSLLLDSIPGPINEEQKKILCMARDNISRLTRIITEILDFSKLASGQIELIRDRINICSMTQEVAQSFETPVNSKGIQMRVSMPSETLYVYADSERVFQIFSGIIGNAVRFTESGHIDLVVKDMGAEVECTVRDTGIGIDKKDLPMIFERFRQIGRTNGGGDRGTGLGLSIVKELVEKHEGSIRVQSEKGKGTTVFFSLPKYVEKSNGH